MTEATEIEATEPTQPVAATKAELRAQLKAQRRAIPAEERARIDAIIAERVTALPEFQRTDLLLPYLSFGAEVRTHEIIQRAWDLGKTVALPRCVPGERTMTWHQVASFNDLVKSHLGVLEPDPARAPQILGPIDAATASSATAAAAPAVALKNALALVPGLTFDPQGFRLGYGGGFYDVFLSTFPGTSVGLCRDQQLSPAVPLLDAHDLPATLVITESRTIRPTREGQA
ncbi:MAG: 5-formyltetrahydrofolate cyclo-ligase [Coriobacteriia bacterium]|nr:5-formyltetrahydrofolate cyclo-ligase [Coriobacteriia bacterium]